MIMKPRLSSLPTLAVVVVSAGVAVALGWLGGEAAVAAARRVAPVFRSPFVISSYAPEGPITNLFGGPGSESSSQIITDGKGHWVLVWHSTDPLDGRIGRDWDILVSRSSDNGATWSDRVPLNRNAAVDNGRDVSPVLATDGEGVWVATWTSTESFAGTYGSDRDVFVARSTDNGATWSAPLPLNTNAASDWGDDRGARIAADHNGNWVAVWASTESLGSTLGGDRDIFVARSSDSGLTWSAPMVLNTNAASDRGFDNSPDIASDGHGRWLAVWSSGDSRGGTIGTDSDILSALSDDNGVTWSDPQPLNSNAADDVAADSVPRLTTDGHGNWVTLWASTATFDRTIGFDRDIFVAASSDNGASWSAAKPLSRSADNDSREDSSPSVVTDGQGEWVAVWHSWGGLSYTDGSDADIMVSYSSDAGRSWSPPELINRAGAKDVVDDLLPGLALDGSGHMVAVWQSFYPSAGRVAQAEWRVISSVGVIEEVASRRQSGTN